MSLTVALNSRVPRRVQRQRSKVYFAKAKVCLKAVFDTKQNPTRKMLQMAVNL